jgi:hypothetical protein
LDRTIEYFKRRFDLKGGVDFKWLKIILIPSLLLE